MTTEQWYSGTCEIEMGGFELEARFKYLPKDENDPSYPDQAEETATREGAINLRMITIVAGAPITSKIDITDMLEEAAGGNFELWEKVFEKVDDAGFQYVVDAWTACNAPKE